MGKIILEVDFPEQWDPVKFVSDLSNKRPVSFEGCTVFEVHDVISCFEHVFINEVLKIGLSGIIRKQTLTEAIVGPKTNSNDIINLLIAFLRNIKISNELIIIDPYFFNTNDHSYVSLVTSILNPFIINLYSIHIVTFPHKTNNTIKRSIEKALSASNRKIKFYHHESILYHDRFWISDNRSQGIITGTSLNGLGKKYALVDRLLPEDVGGIVASLIHEKIL